jgi:hypothetical protein
VAFLEKNENYWEYILQKAKYDPPNIGTIVKIDFD